MNEVAASLFGLFFITATSSSISIVWRGITYWMSLPASRALIASLSKVSRTSPLPERNVFVAFAARRVLRDDVPEQRLDEGDRLLVRLAEMPLGTVRGEDVPLRDARRERVGGDDLDAGLQEVVPALDVLRVAVTKREDDDRVGTATPL